jgi:hypothetical protein
MSNKLEFTEIALKDQNTHFNKMVWVDTSFKDAEKAIGKLRLPGVDNGRYETKHPIYDDRSERVGFLIKGWETLGYTYGCVYIDKAECFFISNVLYRATKGLISIVEPKGRFFFSQSDIKFQRTSTIVIPKEFISFSSLAYKVNANKNTLFSLNTYGFYLINTQRRQLNYYKTFDDLSFCDPTFTLSDNENLLAVCFCQGYADPLDGQTKYKNILRVYDINSGELLGEKRLQSLAASSWALRFDRDNREISLVSNKEQYCFQINYVG